MPQIETMFDALVAIGENIGAKEPINQRAYVKWKQDVYYYTIITYGFQGDHLINVDNAFWAGETSDNGSPNRSRAIEFVTAELEKFNPGDEND